MPASNQIHHLADQYKTSDVNSMNVLDINRKFSECTRHQSKPLAEGLCASCARIFHHVSQKSTGLFNAPYSRTDLFHVECLRAFVEKRKCVKTRISESVSSFALSSENGHRNLRDDENSIWDEAMSRARVFEWFRRFKEGRQSVNSDPRSGRPSTSRNEGKIAQVKSVVRSGRRLTVREIAQECHISVGSCDEILRKNLNIRRVSAKFEPRFLTEDQQFQRLATSSDLLQSASDDPEFMKLITTGDESWVYGYDPETKQQSSKCDQRSKSC
ncbi:protein GVQW3 [Trichonephila clavipes]|nr:protein GVQW3 [Trichonephila clavipes]